MRSCILLLLRKKCGVEPVELVQARSQGAVGAVAPPPPKKKKKKKNAGQKKKREKEEEKKERGRRKKKGKGVENGSTNRQSFRASRREGGTEFKFRIKGRERYNESSSFSNNLMKRQNFAREGGGGGTEFRQWLRVEKGTTNRLLSLII